ELDNSPLSLAVPSLIHFSALAQAVPDPASETSDSYQITERGKDFAVYSRLTSSTNASGKTNERTIAFTLLENNLNYVENGVWKPSEDVIESIPSGAIAQRGPDTASFSPDMNSPAVFDVETFDGSHMQGGEIGRASCR